MSLQHSYAVEHDGCVIPESDLDPNVRRILQRIARCSYMVDQHRRGIALNTTRIAELQAELQRIEGGS